MFLQHGLLVATVVLLQLADIAVTGAATSIATVRRQSRTAIHIWICRVSATSGVCVGLEIQEVRHENGFLARDGHRFLLDWTNEIHMTARIFRPNATDADERIGGMFVDVGLLPLG